MTETFPDFFSDPVVIQNPRDYFERLRSRSPVLREPHHQTLMVTGYDEAVEVLTRNDGSLSSAVSVVGPIPPLPFQPRGGDIREQLEAHRAELPWAVHLACQDGKVHAEQRALLTRLLTYKRLKDNEDYLRQLADRVIDGFIGRGRCDAAAEYAHAVATYAISDLMGIPEGDRAELVELLGVPPSQVEGDAVHRIGPDPLIFLKERFDGYLHERQASPGSDLMSELVAARYRDGSPPAFDVLSNLARFLFGAGQDTTSRLVAHAIRALGDDAELQRRMRDEPARLGDFIEEVLRYDPPVKVVYRLALTDLVVAGQQVAAGTILTVSLTGASNDPRHFDHPDVIDIDRPRLRDHLGFSRGVHGCLGAPLARIEARVALERLLARTGEIRISEERHGAAGARRYRYEPTYTFRSLSDLHIEFTPA